MGASLPLALDAMGGDNAPGEIIAGARGAVDELGVRVTLVGQPERITAAPESEGMNLGDTALGGPASEGISVHPASEVIAMDADGARAVRRMKDSSLVRAAELVRDGKASAMISAGNTGATVASALLRMGRIKGVSRPAVATPIPVPGSTPTVLLDAGAMADCQPSWLAQFAQMGSVYATKRFGIDEPRVGLLSIGEEASKGNQLTKEAHARLVETPGINFIGNVEGRDIMTDGVDVVVTDGFTGNVVLKTLEGGLKAMVAAVLEALASEPQTLGLLAPLATQMDPDTYGGAMLLGVDGVCIISHGSSGRQAVVNAMRVARDMVEADLVGALAARITPEPTSRS